MAAGKHVFLAKPVAVDAPGCQTILASGEKAKGRFSFLVDFQTRANKAYQDAVQRIHAQSAQQQKLAAANIVVTNTGSYEDLWKQVNDAWKKVVPSQEPPTTLIIQKPAAGSFSLHRGKPRDAQKIAELVTRLSRGKRAMNSEEVMEAFGDKAFLLLQLENDLVGLAGWQVENLVARTTDLFLDPRASPEKALPLLLAEVEKASSDLQCEASLVFPTADLALQEAVWKKLGYEGRAPEALGVQVEPVGGIPGQAYLDAGRGVGLRELRDKLIEGGRNLGAGRPSLSQDVTKGRRTEVDYLNGYVARKGQELGVPTPMNDAVVQIVKQVEVGAVKPGPANLALLGKHLV